MEGCAKTRISKKTILMITRVLSSNHGPIYTYFYSRQKLSDKRRRAQLQFEDSAVFRAKTRSDKRIYQHGETSVSQIHKNKEQLTTRLNVLMKNSVIQARRIRSPFRLPNQQGIPRNRHTPHHPRPYKIVNMFHFMFCCR